MNQINREQLNILLCVAESASFSVAARQLNVSPKFVSKQIARLEAALGTALFVRSTRHLALTDEGRVMLAHAHTAHQALAAMQELAADKDALDGSIRLTAPVPLGRKYLAPMIADFVALYPQLAIELSLSDKIADIHKERFDLAVRIGDLPDSALLARRIGRNERVLVASPEYLARYGVPRHVDELNAHRLLVFAYAGFVDDMWVLQGAGKQAGKTCRIKAEGSLRSDNGDVLTTWCQKGLGISLREKWNVRDDVRAGRLVRVLEDWQTPGSNISFVYPKHAYLPKRLRVFMDFVVGKWEEGGFSEWPE